jgi:hypothetical protein
MDGMKLRFRANSIRLRLNQIEVKNLAGGKPAEESVSFPGGQTLVYRLLPVDAAGSDARLAGSTIEISVPREQLKAWNDNDDIGLYFDAGVLSVAIEKDLECTDGPPEERDPHAFPRNAAC